MAAATPAMTRHAAKITPRNKVRIGPRRVDAGKGGVSMPGKKVRFYLTRMA
jgi:hypothetical protein